MRLTVLSFMMVLALALTSLSLKAVRYTQEMSTLEHVTLEQQFIESVARSEWRIKKKAPMNTNKSSYVYILQNESCSNPVMVSILGRDASDKYLLAQYLQQDDVVFLLNGKEVKHLLTPKLYIMSVQSNIESLYDESTPLPLALSVYSETDSAQCNFVL